MVGWTPNLSWIQDDLAVGGSFPMDRAAALASDHGVGAVIDVRRETCDDAEVLSACGLRFLHLPTLDMAGVAQPMLDLGVGFAAETAREGRRLLVHCQHGIGRSATIALCILVDRGLPPLEALELAKSARTLVSPSEDQYHAWARWIDRRGRGPPPTYDEFGVIAYRHLTQTV